MNSVIEKEANNFYKSKFNSLGFSLEKLKNDLTSKLLQFNNDRYKLDFLRVLRNIVVSELASHKITCTNINCQRDESDEIKIFAIDQEIDSINTYYSSVDVNVSDQFTPEQESHIHQKLDSIIEEFRRKADIDSKSFEIIFNEIDELKSHFNLGKKNWTQLFQGKLVDIVTEKSLEGMIDQINFLNICRSIKGYIGREVELLNS